MARVCFTVAYDGRPFAGWQVQPVEPTVQGCLEHALGKLLRRPTTVYGSGRTDAGVHAWGQVFHIIEPPGYHIPEARWPIALNTFLPPTIRILNVRRVSDHFHARFSATGKTYHYHLTTSRAPNPFEQGLVWQCLRPIDEDLLAPCAKLFLGEHDFRAFAVARGNEPDPIPDKYFHRTITQASCTKQGRHIVLAFTGNGFLYRMVRLMVGGIFSVATGRITQDQLKQLITDPKDGPKSPYCAPPDGLYLQEVHYDKPYALNDPSRGTD